MSTYMWNGYFVKKKVYEARLRQSENAKQRIQKIKEEKERLEAEQRRLEEGKPTCVVEGSRIIEMKHMSDQMYCCVCSEPLLLKNIEKELRCHKCLLMNIVKSGKEYINPSTGQKVFAVNTKTVLGAIHTGFGQTHVNELFNIVDLPNLHSQLFKKHERIIGPVIEYVAKESCSEATAMARAMTLDSVEELKKLL